MRVSNEGVIEDLQLQVRNLEQKVQLLEEEKSALQTSQSSTNETQLAQLRALEMVNTKYPESTVIIPVANFQSGTR